MVLGCELGYASVYQDLLGSPVAAWAIEQFCSGHGEEDAGFLRASHFSEMTNV